MDGEGWNRHWKFRGRHWISDEQKLADVSETGLSWKSEGEDDEDVMFDGITITPFEGGKVGVGRMGYCDGIASFGDKAWKWAAVPVGDKGTKAWACPESPKCHIELRRAPD